jgi:hypothetical protein
MGPTPVEVLIANKAVLFMVPTGRFSFLHIMDARSWCLIALDVPRRYRRREMHENGAVDYNYEVYEDFLKI